MSPRVTLPLLLGCLALWGLGLWQGQPWPVTLTLGLPGGPAPPSAALGPPSTRWLQATVTRTTPGLEGFAVGDPVTFDRYGILPPTAGSTVCTPLAPGTAGPVQVTPLGGRAHADLVALALVDPATPACTAARPEPQLSLHP